MIKLNVINRLEVKYNQGTEHTEKARAQVGWVDNLTKLKTQVTQVTKEPQLPFLLTLSYK